MHNTYRCCHAHNCSCERIRDFFFLTPGIAPSWSGKNKPVLSRWKPESHRAATNLSSHSLRHVCLYTGTPMTPSGVFWSVCSSQLSATCCYASKAPKRWDTGAWSPASRSPERYCQTTGFPTLSWAHTLSFFSLPGESPYVPPREHMADPSCWSPRLNLTTQMFLRDENKRQRCWKRETEKSLTWP